MRNLRFFGAGSEKLLPCFLTTPFIQYQTQPLDSRWFWMNPQNREVMADFRISQLAVPFVVLLIAFLSYSSQYLFLYIDPAPLDTSELVKFNFLVACIWICYVRSCLTDPGRIPKDWRPPPPRSDRLVEKRPGDDGGDPGPRQRWCRRCEAYKPPRSHHCKTCQR